mmetsp:Transcript_8071/g.13430  ORF Transcript_8071/g.13430 Transcript_8071/m.13430 type:complete len:193 (+) Transcript_8071:59-637(+)|eukprot:CAMPEP_0174962890 /NCGR_PEP_ID=MMETSP0004_2-20121128/5022_1 /TAXON_ID=420556 /ORGANISM="Ochromonas sp., Strain CCMP1393" /LENGTH=192 /DNA_ID=CAMNT_0016211447 /DNA_START=59 /DNA_END=637 /DNA_ORIENTATION=+
MPSFETLIAGAPLGFCQSCTSVNALAVEDANTISTLVSKLIVSPNSVSMSASEEKYSEQIRCIDFILRCYKAAVPSPEAPQMAAVLDTCSLLNRKTVEIIVVTIQEIYAKGSPAVSSLLSQSSGKLLNLKWRVGVAIASSKCKSLGHPYVLLTFDIKETDGSLSHHSMELTYDEFRSVHASFEKVALTMDQL